MTNPFYSPKQRIARAKERVGDLDRGVNRFFEKKPFERFIEPDSSGHYELHKIKITKRFPASFTNLTYDVIEGLRSALDQAVYAIALASGTGRPDKVHFPIADTFNDFKNAMGNCKGLPTDILTLMRGFKPYKGGNDIIWALNRIRRQSYHRLLVPVGTASQKMYIKNMTFTGPGGIPFPKWNPEKNEMIILRIIPGAPVEYNLDIYFFVAFGEVEGVAGQPVLGFLNTAMDEVERVVLAIEAEARRIGLIA